jgi:hypothetical protein
MNHPSAAYGKALMKQDNKGGTLDPVQPANRHRNVGRQARRILTCHWEQIRRLWRQRSVKRRLAKKFQLFFWFYAEPVSLPRIPISFSFLIDLKEMLIDEYIKQLLPESKST